MSQNSSSTKDSLLSGIDYLFLGILVTSLFVVSRFNYMLFHSLVEIAISSLGFIAFAFTWHLRRFDLKILLNIGMILGTTAIISVFHMLSFKDMGVFDDSGNLATQLWIASRSFFSVNLLFVLLNAKKKSHPERTLSIMILLSLVMIGLVYTGNFPDCFIPGEGQTNFKVISEYVISIVLLTCLGIFWKKREDYPENVSKLIMIFLVFSALTEIIFTSYLTVYDFSNLMGHMFHLTASYFLYKAIVENGLKKPVSILFRDLNQAVLIRDEFISLASHELKTPLTPLKLQLQILEKKLEKSQSKNEFDQQLERSLKISMAQVTRLNKLIDGMLDVSRLNTGKFTLTLSEVNLKKVIEDIAQDYSGQIQQSGSSLSTELNDVMARVDLVRIEQVLINLLTNSLKYAPGSNISVTLKRSSDNKIVIVHSDTGPGIPDSYKDKIFDRYERVDSTNSNSGLGLGLYISKQIIEAHGGEISVKSSKNTGSQFTIILP